MNAMKLLSGAAAVLTISACVTINVYFPAAAAERAADRIIDEVWGEKGTAAPAAEPVSELLKSLMLGALDLLVPAAHAQADLDISSPAIERITASMSARHEQLSTWYSNGAVGQTTEGTVAVRDAKAVPLKDRADVNNLVAKENLDRQALYREIAVANQHPEWEGQIRSTFARRWAERAAREGWWYQGSNGWQQG